VLLGLRLLHLLTPSNPKLDRPAAARGAGLKAGN